MYSAKVKYPYKKEWEKDIGYGLSAPITVEIQEIGDYKQYINATDPGKQWVRELKKGDEIYLEVNSNGNGYTLKQTSEETPEACELEYDDLQVKNNAKILGACIKEIESNLQGANTQFTSEDIRCLAISLFIQIKKGQLSSRSIPSRGIYYQAEN